jgi:nitroimidazol reductase NimA-like FMN-containing flavoprotein (pyridoxamine 5'-phosphate oxidase superfamily)
MIFTKEKNEIHDRFKIFYVLITSCLGDKMAVFSQKELEYLREQLLGRLGTVSKDQLPHITPVAFATDGEKLFMNIKFSSKKARNIRENQNVIF